MKGKISNLIWGALFILVGIGFMGNIFWDWNFNIFFSGFWTLFIIIPSVVSIAENGPRPFSLTALIIGVLLLLSALGFFTFDIVTDLIVPVIFIAIGLSLITKNVWGPTSKMKKINVTGTDTDYSAIFGSQNVTFFENEVFQGANVTAVFGGAKLDLRSAIVNEDVKIECAAIFGGIDIYVPGDVNIKIASTPIFGGVDNKVSKRQWIEGAPTIYINAVCMFGGVDVK